MNFYDFNDYEEFEVLDEELDNLSYVEKDGHLLEPINNQTPISKPKAYNNIKYVAEMLSGISRFAFEANLLELVFDRAPLYDYTLPIRSRSPSIINQLWDEVKDELQKQYAKIDIKKHLIKIMYKNLRNNYTRYKTLKDRPTSGQAQKPIPEPKHINQLRRLDGVLLKRKQKCSLNLETSEESSSPRPLTTPSPTPVENINLDDDNMFPPRKRARTLSGQTTKTSSLTTADFLTPLNQLVANTCNRPIIVPTPTSPDMEQLFGSQVTLFLRQLNIEEKYVAQSYISNYMTEVIRNKNNK